MIAFLFIIIYTYCDEIKQYVPSEGVLPLRKHLLSKAHANSAQIKEKQTRLNFACKSSSKDFHIKLVNAFTKADIPLFKLQNKYIKELLEDIGQVEIRDESFYRKIIMEEVCDCHMKKLKRLYCDKKLYIVFDETTDSNWIYILNILIGECSKEIRKSPVILKVVELIKMNSENINLEILQALNFLYDSETRLYSNIKLLLNDGARYARKAGVLLKKFIPNLKNVTWSYHALHNLCQTIRSDCSNVYLLVSFLKRVLVKNRSNQMIFKEIVKTPISKFLIVTRWGTWIEFVLFIHEKFDLIISFIKALPGETTGIHQILNFIDSIEIEN